MKKLIIGALLLLIGIPGFSFNFFNFLIFAAGLVPVLITILGAIAVYLGIKELKQSENNENQAKVELPPTQQKELNKEGTGKSETQTQPLPDTKSTQPEPETEEKNADKQNPDKQPEAQPEEKAPIPSTYFSQATEPPAPEEIVPIVATVQYKGNIETLVFHSIACNFASGKNCSMDFTTKEEAEAQGYKPCKMCMVEA